MRRKQRQQKRPQTVVLKLDGKVVGYESWEANGDGFMRSRISETLDGPPCGPIPHDQRCLYRTPSKKTTGRLTADKFYTSDEIKALYHAANITNSIRGKTTAFILAMLLNTGLRATELCELPISHTPFVLGVDQLKVLGKGNKIRPVHILPELSEKIRWYVKNIRPKFIVRPMRVKDYSQPLLLRENGQPYNRVLLWKRIHRLGERAGLKKAAGVHRCRHTYATHRFQKGMDIVTLQGQLGHTNINTTAIYAKADETATQAMLRQSAGVLNGGQMVS